MVLRIFQSMIRAITKLLGRSIAMLASQTNSPWLGRRPSLPTREEIRKMVIPPLGGLPHLREEAVPQVDPLHAPVRARHVIYVFLRDL
jgi:hypothetical protein